jgi:hypothetical protein
MGPLEARMFVFLSAGSLSATAYFRVPPSALWSRGLSSRFETLYRAHPRRSTACSRPQSVRALREERAGSIPPVLLNSLSRQAFKRQRLLPLD